MFDAAVGYLRLLVGLLFLAVVSPVFMIAAVLLLPSRVLRIKLCNVYGKIAGRGIIAITGAQPRVKNRERLDASMPAIYVANHTSTLDAFLSIWLCPFGGCGVLKKEVTRTPFFGQIAVLSGNLLIDRSNREKAVEALNETAAFVREHRLGVWIMPEGTRSKDGRLLPFKKGFVHMAIASGLPVVPVVIHGAHKNWAKGRVAHFEAVDIDIEVLPKIDTSSWKEETAGEHAEMVHAVFAAALLEEQKPLSASQPADSRRAHIAA